ncbi:MAG: PA14 domain-containing protein, partial [Actinomycetota bacterium]
MPTISSDGLTATYVDVWPGVDVRFVVTNGSVSKEIVITRAGTTAEFAVAVEGAVLDQGPDGKIATRADSEFRVGQAEVFDRKGVPVGPDAGVGLALRRDGAVSVVGLSVSPQWLAGLADDEFPVVVDPSWSWWSSTNFSYAFASNGFTCAANPNCARPRVGNSLASGDTIWRSVVAWDYSSVQPTAAVASSLLSAVVNVSYYSGDTNWRNIALRHATGFDWCGFNLNHDCGQGYSPLLGVTGMATGAVSFDVTAHMLDGNWGAGKPNIAWAYSSDEPSGVYTFKEITSSITLTYDRLPVIPTGGMWPGNGYTFHSSADGVHLQIPQLSDPDGEPLYYRFVLCDATCSVQWDDSGWDTITASDPDPWDYYSSLYPPGPGLTAGFYNEQLYWKVMVSNSPIGAGFQQESTWNNSWRLFNTCPAAPQLNFPAAGFVWAPNNPPTFVITPYLDSDGDWASYRLVIREQGSNGVLWTSDWTASSNSTAALSFTPPLSAPLQSGVTYEWSAEARDSTTYFHWYFFHGAPCQAASSFRTESFEDRLGTGGPSPMQPLGPVTVNLATGNLTTAVATPQVSVLGGSMGVSMAYNSRANDIGLRGRFFNDTNGNSIAEDGELVSSRLDRAMTMKWATPGAAPGITNFIGTWTGYMTVPTAGTYHIAAAVGADERVQVQVGGYTLQANYANAAAIPINDPTDIAASAYAAKPNVSVPAAGFTTTVANTVLPVTVTYRNPTSDGYLALYVASGSGIYATFPLSWLSPEARVLPRGWTFNNLDSLGAEYSASRVEATEIVLTRPDGSTVSYARNGTGYTAPPGEDDVVAYTNGKVTVTSVSGLVHSFRDDGQLDAVRAPIDAKTPAAPTPTWTQATLPGWSQATARMTALTDPISNTAITLKYEGVGTGACPTDTTLGFIAPPPGMLCRVTYPDTSVTELWYLADGQGGVVLSRVTNPGSPTLGKPTVDFGYTLVAVPAPSTGTYTVALLASVRDPLVNDALAASLITESNGDYRTLITYDSEGRVTSVTAPKPSAAATGRQKIWVDYQISGGVTYNETRTRIDGLDNTGSSTDWDRRAQFDQTARVTYDYQALDATSSTFMLTQTGWDSVADRVLWVQANNQVTRNVYSAEGWVTDTYGPANASCFAAGTFMPNGACTNPPVAHTANTYDGGISGLAGSYWPNATFSGPPTNLATGIGPNYTTMSNNWNTGGPPEAVNTGGAQLTDNFSLRLSGSIVFPATGTYTITTTSDDAGQLYIDDQLVTTTTCCTPVAGTVTVTGSTTKRIRIDHVENSGGALLTVQWAGPGITGTVAIPTTALKPRYGLVTSSTTDDSGGAPSTTTTATYTATGIDPAYGLATSATSGGLTTTTGYESSGYRRRTSRTLPGGNTYTYSYYTA